MADIKHLHQTAEENEEFYREGLAKLHNGVLEESSGKLILDLMGARAEETLVPYARSWVKAFPHHEVAPRLVGRWLAKFYSNEVMYLATSYVNTFPDVKALWLIVAAAGAMPRKGKRLLSAIEKRLDREPNNHIWGSIQHMDHHDDRIDNLLVLWIQRNLTNTDIVGTLSGVALFTNSAEVLAETIRWAEINRTLPRYFWMVLGHLLCGKSKAHADASPRVIALAREWIQLNEGDEFCGTIFERLMQRTESVEDINAAKKWYQAHSESRTSANALRGILCVTHSIGQPADSQMVECAKRRLTAKAPAERGGLIGCLLKACPGDEEVIRLARETLLARQIDWLLADLLEIAPDDELLAKSNNILKTFSTGSPCLIEAALKIDRKNEVARQAAKRWIKNYPGNDQVQSLESLLKG